MPESEVKNRVLSYLTVGVPVGYVGELSFDVVENWPSTEKYKEGVHEHVMTHLRSGAIEGPVDTEHFPHKISPLGAFPKKNSEKTRVIHDLSFPPGKSVNDGISGEECSVTYSTVLDAVELCKKYPTPWLAKYDIKDAYMHCAVKRSDRHLLGFKWYDENGDLVVYRQSSIPFGMRSSCRAFTDIAECLMFMCKKNGAADDSLFYLDDAITICGNKMECEKSIRVMVDTAEKAGFVVQDAKTVGPARKITFLGIEIDSINAQLKIPHEKLLEVRQELSMWLDKVSCTKRELLSILGVLQYCAKVVRDGRKFVGRLIQKSKEGKNLHSRVYLCGETKKDIRWWHKCMCNHNGVSYFPRDIDISTAKLLFTDASDFGAAGVVDSKWTIRQFVGQFGWMKRKSIAYRELFAVVLAISTFGNYLKNTQVLMNIDNESMQIAVKQGKSKDKEIMALIRVVYFYTSIYKIDYSTMHIPGHRNSVADAASRGNMVAFRSLAPHCDPQMTPPIDCLLNF